MLVFNIYIIKYFTFFGGALVFFAQDVTNLSASLLDIYSSWLKSVCFFVNKYLSLLGLFHLHVLLFFFLYQ